MKTIKLSELKVGDEISNDGNYKTPNGYYSDIIVSAIRKTKTGRIRVFVDQTYIKSNGEKLPRQFGMPRSNGAHCGTTPIEIV